MNDGIIRTKNGKHTINKLLLYADSITSFAVYAIVVPIINNTIDKYLKFTSP